MKENRPEAERWLAQARDDLETVRVLVEAGRNAAACFQAQQAAEKAALHYLRGERFVYGHSVSELLREAGLAEEEAGTLLERASLLDQFYIPARYPNGLPGGIPSEHYGPGQARRAFEDAEAIIRFVAERLGA